MLDYKNGELVVTDAKMFDNWLNGCKVRHYTKLRPCNELSEIYQLYSDKRNHPRGLLAILELTFCKYFNEDELDKFILVLNEVIKYKKENPKTTLIEVLNFKINQVTYKHSKIVDM